MNSHTHAKPQPWLYRASITLVLLLLIQGCTNSKLIIGPLYNRLDDRMRTQFEELGDFNEEQKAAFEVRLGTYHVWHRQSELPQYAQLMTSIANSISAKETTQAAIQAWFDTAERHSVLARECHPISFSFDLIKSLSDEEINVIEQKFKDERLEDRAKYDERTPEERVKRRVRNIVKWAGRINIEFTSQQEAMLRSAFERQISLRKEYYALSDNWNQEFFTLARAQDNPNYNSAMDTQLSKLWHLLEDAYPNEWQENRDLWKEVSLRMIQSMSPEQRTTLSRWVNKMAKTLVAISKDEPSFKYVNDASLGCAINPG